MKGHNPAYLVLKSAASLAASLVTIVVRQLHRQLQLPRLRQVRSRPALASHCSKCRLISFGETTQGSNWITTELLSALGAQCGSATSVDCSPCSSGPVKGTVDKDCAVTTFLLLSTSRNLLGSRGRAARVHRPAPITCCLTHLSQEWLSCLIAQ